MNEEDEVRGFVAMYVDHKYMMVEYMIIASTRRGKSYLIGVVMG